MRFERNPGYKTNNLQGFVFKKMLDCALQIHAEDDLIASGDIKQNLHHWLKTHQKYLTHRQVSILTDVYMRELKQDDDDSFHLISVEEYQAILQTELGIVGTVGKFGFEGDLGDFKYS